MIINYVSKIKKEKITSFTQLAAVLLLSSIATVQLATSNVYAQSSSDLTVTASCYFIDTHGLVLDYTVRGVEPFPPAYYYQLLDSSGAVIDTSIITTDLGGSLQDPKSGEEYSLNVYQDVNNNYQTVGVEEDELVASTTTTCPSYTELFRNQGECIQFAREHPFAGSITRERCQEAF
jgi:hypothetical protein